jgi:hypothetical protein
MDTAAANFRSTIKRAERNGCTLYFLSLLFNYFCERMFAKNVLT